MSESYESLESKCMIQEQEIEELRKLKEAVVKIEQECKKDIHLEISLGQACCDDNDNDQYFASEGNIQGDILQTFYGESLSTALIKLSEKLEPEEKAPLINS